MSDKGRARLHAGLAAGDPHDEVLDAGLAKESLRDFYAATTLSEAVRLLDVSSPNAGRRPRPSCTACPGP